MVFIVCVLRYEHIRCFGHIAGRRFFYLMQFGYNRLVVERLLIVQQNGLSLLLVMYFDLMLVNELLLIGGRYSQGADIRRLASKPKRMEYWHLTIQQVHSAYLIALVYSLHRQNNETGDFLVLHPYSRLRRFSRASSSILAQCGMPNVPLKQRMTGRNMRMACKAGGDEDASEATCWLKKKTCAQRSRFA